MKIQHCNVFFNLVGTYNPRMNVIIILSAFNPSFYLPSIPCQFLN